MSDSIDQKRRKHRANGIPRGGLRSPAGGRPSGEAALPYGSTRALLASQCARRRFAGQADEEGGKEGLAALEMVMGRVADVLFERVDYKNSTSVLKAAALASDALAGRQTEKHEVEQKVTLASLIDESYALEAEEAKPPPAPVKPVPPVVRRKAKTAPEGSGGAA